MSTWTGSSTPMPVERTVTTTMPPCIPTRPKSAMTPTPTTTATASSTKRTLVSWTRISTTQTPTGTASETRTIPASWPVPHLRPECWTALTATTATTACTRWPQRCVTQGTSTGYPLHDGLRLQRQRRSDPPRRGRGLRRRERRRELQWHGRRSRPHHRLPLSCGVAERGRRRPGRRSCSLATCLQGHRLEVGQRGGVTREQA